MTAYLGSGSLLEAMLRNLRAGDTPAELAQSLVSGVGDAFPMGEVVLSTGTAWQRLRMPRIFCSSNDGDAADMLVRQCAGDHFTGHKTLMLHYGNAKRPVDAFRLADGSLLLVVAEVRHMDGGELRAVSSLLGYAESLIDLHVRNASMSSRLNRLEQATTVAKIGYFEWVIGSERMEWDRQMMALFAVEPEDFSWKPEEFTDRIHPEDRERVIASVDELIGQKTEQESAELTFRIFDGCGQVKKIVAHASLQRNPDGRWALVGTNYDVTELEEARAQTLRRSELEQLLLRLSMNVIRSSGDSIDQITDDALRDVGTFVGADRAYRFVYDFQAGVASNTHEWCASGITPEIENLQETPIDAIPFWVNMHKRGMPFYKSRIADLPDGHGLREILDPQGVQSIITIPLMQGDECIGFIGFDAVRNTRYWSEIEISLLQILAQMLVNALAKHEYERSLVEARAQLQISRDQAHRLAEEAISANAAKSRFIATVSHELRTPLHAIIGLTDVVLERSLDNEVNRHINGIKGSGEVLLALIEDILDYSRIESGNIDIHEQSVDIYALLDSLVESFAGRAAARNLFLRLTVDSDVPSVICADSLRVRQVLSNLVDNALKFTVEGGVTIRVDWESDREALIFTVRDTGIGIDAEDQEHVYGPFFQSDDSDSRRHSGTGLGLSIVSNLVSRMNGEILLESESGKGTVFTVRLPYVTPEVDDFARESRAGSQDSTLTVDLEGIRILLAEDNPMNRQLIELYLGGIDCQLEVVGNGQECLEKYREKAPDIVLMDCQMPVMDGYSATRILVAERDENDRTPIIAVTASAQQDAHDDCIKAGFNDVLVKPFSKTELLRALGAWLNR